MAKLDHLSYSSLTSWERCRKKWALEKLTDAPAKPAWYFAGGSAVHRLTEEIDHLPDLVNPEMVDVTKAWQTYFYPEVKSLMEASGGIYGDTTTWLAGGSKDSPEDGSAWDEVGPMCVSNWMKFVKEEVEKIHHVELDVSTSLPGVPVPVKGFKDRGVLHREHDDLSLDIKTGKSKPKDYFQLAVYYVLELAKFGEAPTKGAYFMARTGKMTKPGEFDGVTVKVVTNRLALAAYEILDATEFPADRQFTCVFCPMQDNCVEYSGATPQALHFEEKLHEGT